MTQQDQFFLWKKNNGFFDVKLLRQSIHLLDGGIESIVNSGKANVNRRTVRVCRKNVYQEFESLVPTNGLEKTTKNSITSPFGHIQGYMK